MSNTTPPIMNHLFELIREEETKEKECIEYLEGRGFICYKKA